MLFYFGKEILGSSFVSFRILLEINILAFYSLRCNVSAEEDSEASLD